MNILFKIYQFNSLLRLCSGLFVIVFLSVGLFSCKAQKNDTNYAYADECIRNLKNDGTLLVFLPSYREKVDQLNKILESKSITNKKREKVEAWLQDTKNRKERERVVTIESFETNYTFSRLLFAYDYQVKSLDNDSSIIETVNRNGESQMTKLDGFTLLATYLWNDTEDGTALRSYYIKDIHQKTIPGFPAKAQLKHFSRFMRALFKNDEEEFKENIVDIVTTTNEHFYGFYQQVVGLEK